MDDASIIKLFLQRNEVAISELQNKYEKLLFKIAGNILKQNEDVEECVNSTLLSVWNSIPPQTPTNLRAYTCKIAKRNALNKLKYIQADKRNLNLTDSLFELEDCVSDDEYVEDSVFAKELEQAVNRFLLSQKKIDRNLFIRRYWYFDSIESIAEFYGLNSKTVASRLCRTRKRLKEFLIKEGLANE